MPSTAADKSFDVFISHSSDDKPDVLRLYTLLRKRKVRAWMDSFELIPGDEFQDAIEAALRSVPTCVVCVGPNGYGPWQNEEMRAAIHRRARERQSGFRVIPVLLPGAKRGPKSALPEFLQSTIWVEFPSIDDAAALEQLIRGIRRVRGAAALSRTVPGVCPYRGLHAFDTRSARFFYGREAMTAWLIAKLRATLDAKTQMRLLAVLGPSGSGKSSLAQAGLLASLQKGALAGSDTWQYCVCRPGSDPLETLAVQLRKLLPSADVTWDRLLNDLASDQRSLHLYVRLALAEHPERKFVFLIDQFEECFTLAPDGSAPSTFFENLIYAASAPSGQTVVLLTLRADFYGKCASYPLLAAALSEHQELVGSMTEDEIRRAIELPAADAGCEFENGLVDLLLRDTESEPGALPMLQHALLELWNKRSGRLLTIDAYREIGGVAGALQQRAEQLYSTLSDAEKEVCRRMMLRLVETNEGMGDTKRHASLRELIGLKAGRELVEAVAAKLCDPDVRLVRTWANTTRPEDPEIELSHEALIRSWPRLHDWMQEARSNLETQRRIAEATLEWIRQKRNRDFLFSGMRLLGALDWADRHSEDLSNDEREFLEESRERHAQERRLSDAASLDQLELSAPRMWHNAAEKRRWLDRACALTSAIPEHQKQLERLRAGARVTAGTGASPVWAFDEEEAGYLHDTIALLIERLARFSSGLMSAAEHSLRVASSLERLTIDEPAEAWEAAIRSIADESQCPAYRGLSLAPQAGLVPLARNERSGLWEFLHLLTGNMPAAHEGGEFSVCDDTGIILVLIPGGAFHMGSRPPSPEMPPGLPNIDPYCRAAEEMPVHEVTLSPFFLAKYPLTQGQFLRSTGTNVSYHRPGDACRQVTLAHPVECTSWSECQEALENAGLTLPTEAQWEFAARGGTSSVWWTGNDPAAVIGKANLLGCRESVFPHSYPSPVGLFRFPNPFGLHDVMGNVWEWCLDWFGLYNEPVAEGTGERRAPVEGAKVCRGGSFFNTVDFARSAVRYFRAPRDARFNNLGARAARRVI